jgi:arylsulfatase A-like enzyme
MMSARPKAARTAGDTSEGTTVSGPVTLAEALWLATCAGLLAGYLELTALAVRRVWWTFLLLSPEISWLIPATYLVLFVAFAMGLFLAGSRLPGLRRRSVLAGVMVAMVVFCPLLVAGGLSRYAIAIIAIGVGMRGSALLVPRWTRSMPWVIRSVSVMALALLLTVASRPVATWHEDRRLGDLPSAPSGAPNIVLIVLDTVRPDHTNLGHYAKPTTPVLSEIARQGVYFDHAVSTSSWTLPAHASLFTGHWPHEHGADWRRPLSSQWPTLGEVLATAGYATAGFTGNNGSAGAETGLGRGFVHYADYSLSWGEVARSTALMRNVIEDPRVRRLVGFYDTYGRRDASEVSAELLRWIDRHPKRPFFVFANFFDAHAPYLPPPGTGLRLGPAPQRRPEPHVRSTADSAGLAADIDAYDRALAGLDDRLGILFDLLRRRGVLDNALLVIVADHGEEFMEHGEAGHGLNLYRTTVDVPVLLVWQGHLPAATTMHHPISLRDVPSTILELVGIPNRSLPGRSFARIAQGVDVSPRRELLWSELTAPPKDLEQPFNHLGGATAVQEGNMRLIRDGRGREELFDLQSDPGELVNRTGLGPDSLLARFRAALDQMRDGTEPNPASWLPSDSR